MKEIWKNIDGCDNYMVSSLGRIKSLKRGRPVILKTTTNNRGYKKCLLLCNGLRKTLFVHRLVAIGFIPNPNNKPQVNHINGQRSDNKANNLEWVTQSENIIHGRRFLGHKNVFQHLFRYHKHGENHHNSKLKHNDVIDIRKMYNDKNIKVTEISKKYNISRQTVRHIGKSITWKTTEVNSVRKNVRG